MSKSANKHNRLTCNAMPLHLDLPDKIDGGEITMKMDVKERVKKLAEFDWDKSETLKIWSFGPDGEGPNIIMDATKCCQFMHEIKDSMVTGFQVITSAGVLCDEECRNQN